LKILVTGSEGMLGSDVCPLLAEDHEVCGYDVGDLDIADARETMLAVKRLSPSVIVHTAAFTDVDACETERDKAYRTNVQGTGNLAEASRQAGSLLVYISTDYIFDGSKGEPYGESDEPNPINYYGLTKLQGEEHVRRAAARYLIVRTSWLFGPGGRNFVDKILKKALAGENLKVVNDQTGCPTYTVDLARGVKALIESGLEGVVHLTNSGVATWFDLAGYAIGLVGLDAEIEPVPSEAYPTKARRPAYSVLKSDVLGRTGLEPLPDWKEGVRDHLRRRGMLKHGASS
jgi:dTDP-4-dehydrorhamnose reductase